MIQANFPNRDDVDPSLDLVEDIDLNDSDNDDFDDEDIEDDEEF